MGLFSLVVVLLIEQIAPLPYHLVVQKNLSALVGFVEATLSADNHRHDVIAWSAVVGGLVLVAGGIHFVLLSFSPLLAWLWSALLLYLSMGYGQFSQNYSDIQLALRMDDLPQARWLLAGWLERPCDDLTSGDVARQGVEEVLTTAHRHFFAVLFCFILFPGPCGAVLYRVAAFLADFWGRRNDAEAGRFGAFPQQAFAVIDWLPQRLTAAAFSVVGNFEDAMYCWRSQVFKWPESSSGQGLGIVLASGAGALGLRLGSSCTSGDGADEPSEVFPGEDVDVDSMQSAVGLIWRAVVLCLLLLMFFRFAHLVGV